MALTLIQEIPAQPQGFLATTRLWLNAERTELVPEGDEDCAFLFANEGETIVRADAEKYGLIKAEKVAPVETVEEPAIKQAEKPAEKQAPKPKDKQRKPKANK